MNVDGSNWKYRSTLYLFLHLCSLCIEESINLNKVLDRVVRNSNGILEDRMKDGCTDDDSRKEDRVRDLCCFGGARFNLEGHWSFQHHID